MRHTRPDSVVFGQRCDLRHWQLVRFRISIESVRGGSRFRRERRRTLIHLPHHQIPLVKTARLRTLARWLSHIRLRHEPAHLGLDGDLHKLYPVGLDKWGGNIYSRTLWNTHQKIRFIFCFAFSSSGKPFSSCLSSNVIFPCSLESILCRFCLLESAALKAIKIKRYLNINPRDTGIQ